MAFCTCLGSSAHFGYDAGMTILAQTLRLCLALMLALTLSHATVARSQGGTIAGWIALCAGEDVIAVAVDGQGKPVQPHIPCPDCIIAAAVLLPAGPHLPGMALQEGRLAKAEPGHLSGPDVLIAPAARGPPFLV